MSDKRTDSQTVPAGDDWFDNWLSTGTVAQRSVEIFGRPDLIATYEVLQRRLEIAQAVKVDESSLESSEADDLHEEIEAVYKQWMDSKTTWFIRALNPQEIADIEKQAKFPEPLDEEKAKPAEVEAHRDKQRKAESKSNRLAVVKSLVKVENPDGATVKTSISLKEIETLEQQIGENQVLRLVAAAMIAASQEAAIPVPFSRENSKNAQT